MSPPYVIRGWREAASARRIFLIFLVALQAFGGVWSLLKTLPYQGQAPIELALIILFSILFSWISFGFWTAVFGFILIWRGRDRFDLTKFCTTEPAFERSASGRTAIIMPIYNEEVKHAFAGLAATYGSLEKTGQQQRFDFFILSDSNDPKKWVEEEMLWLELCRTVDGFGRIYYRHRRHNLRRKSGNIADFCRRWGAKYDYMVVLDADSVIDGETILRLVRLMDAQPQAALIQTVSLAVKQSSLFGRIQQFANQVYTPMFAAGMHFWSLGESPYWGHNAIIRVEPFMEHCGLPRLPGRPPLGGEILSHDFVEAALLGRAGWEVWLAYNLPGSHEETPPTLHDELQRDQRWCEGNLQHMRFLLARGLRPGHRAVFLSGIATYVSAVVWLVFLCFTTAAVALEALFEPVYFPSDGSLFPLWPRWHPEVALALLGTTFFTLFLPKFLAWLLIIKQGRQKLFGGLGALSASVALEALMSAIFAPIRMMFHSRFVLTTLMGRSVRWKAQRRGQGDICVGEATRRQGWITLIGTVWAFSIYWVNPLALWLFAPIFAGLIFAIPLTLYSSRSSLGRASRRCKLFLIPQETGLETGVVQLKNSLAEQQQNVFPDAGSAQDAFVRAITEPYTNAVHIALSARFPGSVSRESLKLQEKLLSKGAGGLTSAEKRRLLLDGNAMALLHLKVWQSEQPVPGLENENN
jgi:membrane glycosyltransferase